MSKYDRFHGTPWDNWEHCVTCGKDYEPTSQTEPDDISCPFCRKAAEEPQSKPEEYCANCGKPILKGQGRFRLFLEVYCVTCGEIVEPKALFEQLWAIKEEL